MTSLPCHQEAKEQGLCGRHQVPLWWHGPSEQLAFLRGQALCPARGCPRGRAAASLTYDLPICPRQLFLTGAQTLHGRW